MPDFSKLALGVALLLGGAGILGYGPTSDIKVLGIGFIALMLGAAYVAGGVGILEEPHD